MGRPYELKHLIVDEKFIGEESVTADFSYEQMDYSITFSKDDFEMINSWKFVEGSSLPANLPHHIIEEIRNDIKDKV